MTGSQLLRVAIVHPWLPQYRAPFFEQLIAEGKRAGVEFCIFYGAPPPEWAMRNDSVTADFATALKTRFFRIGRRSVGIKSLRAVKDSGPYDLVILEQAVRNLETYFLLLTVPRRRLAFWGHGKTYTVRVSQLQERAKKWLTMRGHWFFAYTAGGAQAVISDGFDPRHVTVVQNSIDAVELRSLVDGVSSEDITNFRMANDLTDHTAVFVGGLDENKRISFMLAAASAAYRLDPNFRLLIIGGGGLREDVERCAADSPWCHYLGPLFGREKAKAMAAARVLVMPGRVGLVAVDSFAAGLPIITTDWPWHAPEFEYLKDGRNAVIARDNEASFAAKLVEVLNDNRLRQHLRSGARSAMRLYSIEEMVKRFLDGTIEAAEQGRHGK